MAVRCVLLAIVFLGACSRPEPVIPAGKGQPVPSKSSADGLKRLALAIATMNQSKIATAEAGAAISATRGCESCHSLDGTRLVGPTFKGTWGRVQKTNTGNVTVDLAYLRESLLTPLARITEGYPAAMPPQVLSELEIQSLALFFETLKAADSDAGVQ